MSSNNKIIFGEGLVATVGEFIQVVGINLRVSFALLARGTAQAPATFNYTRVLRSPAPSPGACLLRRCVQGMYISARSGKIRPNDFV